MLFYYWNTTGIVYSNFSLPDRPGAYGLGLPVPVQSESIGSNISKEVMINDFVRDLSLIKQKAEWFGSILEHLLKSRSSIHHYWTRVEQYVQVLDNKPIWYTTMIFSV